MAKPRRHGPGGKPRWFTGLRFRFVLLFVGLGVLPLLAAAVFIGQQAMASLEQQSIELQQEAAAGIAGEIERAILGRQAELEQLDVVYGLAAAAPEDQSDLLQSLLATQHMYQELALSDASGEEVLRFSRDGVVLQSDLQNNAQDELFVAAMDDGTTQFGAVAFDDDAREPLMAIIHPILDRQSGQVASVVAATIRFKPIWDLLARMDLEGGREVFLVNDTDQIVAHRNPAIVLSGTSYAPPELDGRAAGLEMGEAIAATAEVALGDQRLVVVSEQPVSTALAVVTRAGRITTGVIAVTLVLAGILAALGARLFVKPIEELADSARLVASGDFSHRVTATSKDEIGELAESFNMMTEQLQGIVDTLEQRVSDRTTDLAGAMEVQSLLIAELEEKNEAMARVHRQLEDLVKSKDDFLGAVSHELRTPLTSVMGFADVLAESHRDLGGDELREFLARIAAEAQDMANIINDLLVAAQADSSELVIDVRSVDVAEDIRAVVEGLHGVQPEVEISDVRAMVQADPMRLRQILRNLIVNADRYGGPAISVGVEPANDSLVVRVKDNGPGIPEDEWDAVFDPYRRSHHRPGQPASVGLGLTVSRMLARRMEGDLTYHHDGDHSVFELTLPAT